MYLGKHDKGLVVWKHGMQNNVAVSLQLIIIIHVHGNTKIDPRVLYSAEPQTQKQPQHQPQHGQNIRQETLLRQDGAL